jgi:hypothetical protein
MTDDIVARLRWRASLGKHTGSELSHDCTEAANEIERLRAALSFYADSNNWTEEWDKQFRAWVTVMDGGEIARAALGEKND